VAIETLEHLWTQVLWGTAKRVRSLLEADFLRKTKICDAEVTLHIDKDVFRLEIPKDYVVFVKMLEAQQKLTHVKLGKLFIKPPFLD
jgi:hypothetical protein